ncbi:MAG: YbaK/EbsC family protein [Anaerolineales bacterium]|nr:YbaK/EbsC family protein [Anaerolineales bacterium]
MEDISNTSDMIERPPVSLELERLGIPHRVFRHAGKVTSLEQAAHERGQRPEQVVRSILFRTGEDEYLMALVAGPAQISWKALRAYLSQSRLTMASEAEVLEVTGYPIGAVSPFGTPRRLRVLVDASVFAAEEISIGSGVRGTTVILKSEHLKRALGKMEIVKLIE